MTEAHLVILSPHHLVTYFEVVAFTTRCWASTVTWATRGIVEPSGVCIWPTKVKVYSVEEGDAPGTADAPSRRKSSVPGVEWPCAVSVGSTSASSGQWRATTARATSRAAASWSCVGWMGRFFAI